MNLYYFKALTAQTDEKQQARRLEPQDEPPWKDQVERWYQLDENSRICCEAIYSWQTQGKMPKFDALVLTFPEGSNLSDVEFVNTFPASPAKFVYTLPNIAGTLVAQMTLFHGPIFCFCEPLDSSVPLIFAQKLLQAGHQKVFMLESSLALNQHKERAVKGYLFEDKK